MNESYITVHGYVVATPVVRRVGEHDVANFRIGVTPRKLERSSGEWKDAETQWYSVSAWRALGTNVGRSLRKGDPVIVQGRLSARTWVNASHAEVVAHDIEATVVGHDLRRGVTMFNKTATTAEGVPQRDPYAEGGVADERPRELDVERSAEHAGELSGAQVQTLIEGSDATMDDEQAPVERADRADWSAPLQDAPDWAGAA